MKKMGKSNKYFLDIRQTEDHPPFDHHKRFCEKIKENWLGDKELTRLKNSTDLMELTDTLIKYQVDAEYSKILIKLIDNLEPAYVKGDYLLKVIKTPLENMKRVYNKYDNINRFIKAIHKDHLLTYITKKERELNKK